jgi:membrane-bound serine protease (ClpP class)
VRRLATAALAAVALALSVVAFGGADPAAAQGSEGHLDVIEVSGRIDPVLEDFVLRSVDDAEASGAEALVLQLNSPGSVLSEARLDRLVERLEEATVPVAVWIGPSGASASGGPARLVEAADVSGMDQGTRLHPRGEPSVGPADAVEQGLVDTRSPTLGDFVVDLDGREVDGTTLHTARVRQTDDGPRRQVDVRVFFSKLELGARLMHTVASPSVAYLLLLGGLVLIVFEFFTGGVGVAGLTGAGALVLACYGLDVLPTTGVGLALIAVAMFGFSIDVQTGVPRVWTAIATVALVGGSVRLFDGISLSWITLLAGVVLTLLMMLAGMPSVVRSRFSTPTIGREGMIGEMGEAVQAVRPDGIVRVRDALWRAHTNRATPIGDGEAVRVIGIQGTVLEVEPEEGGARDYRERSRERSKNPR